MLCVLRTSKPNNYSITERNFSLPPYYVLCVLRNMHPPSLPCFAPLLCALRPWHPSLYVLRSRHPLSLLCVLRPCYATSFAVGTLPPSLPPCLLCVLRPCYVLCVIRTSKPNNYSISERNFSLPPCCVLCVPAMCSAFFAFLPLRPSQ